MKKVLIISIFALVSLLSLPVAFAYPVYQGDLVTITDGPGDTGGGEFVVTKSAINFSFNSFCLEGNEYISMGTTYRVGSIGPNAVAGGISGGSPDPVDARTAYLFYYFSIGDLAGYNYDDATQASANALQNAIWFIEGEGGENNYFVTAAQIAINTNAWSGIGDVRALNLVNAETGAAQQSLLTRVPEPMTMLLLGLGLVGLAGLRRKE